MHHRLDDVCFMEQDKYHKSKQSLNMQLTQELKDAAMYGREEELKSLLEIGSCHMDAVDEVRVLLQYSTF